ncbi:hypothetical protein JJB07_07335 [Tumebacillus sp. ITR2]|uniref:DUF2007 domain-containing protein n=1 Tax=Tumebacillus amylolyticus TaxID=2801339 RepID=A0ABS1J844_9BACL|nr:hypothetical protein [Tumebacillus amylolyticus]MBL0386457.1 hypothetical protein [Tumebacillus amylolyticus]
MFRIFTKYKKLVYSCVGHTTYFKVVGKLQGSGIPYRTKSSGGFSDFNMPELISYDIYVKREDEGRALQAIHDRR